MPASFAWASVSNWFLKCPSTSSVKPASGGTSARDVGLDTGLDTGAADVGATAVGAGIGAATAGAGFAGRVRALLGAVAAGFSAALGAALLLTPAGLAPTPFVVAGFAGVLESVLVDGFADAFALAGGRDVFAALRAGALVLAFFMTRYD